MEIKIFHLEMTDKVVTVPAFPILFHLHEEVFPVQRGSGDVTVPHIPESVPWARLFSTGSDDETDCRVHIFQKF